MVIGIGWWFADNMDEAEAPTEAVLLGHLAGVLLRSWVGFSCFGAASAGPSPSTNTETVDRPLIGLQVWRRAAIELPVQLIHDLIALLRDPGPIIQWGGYPALALIIFLETGAMVAFLPGDSLLFVAGLYAAKGDLNIVVLNLLLGHDGHRGRRHVVHDRRPSGAAIFNRPQSRWLKPDHIRAAQDFYEKHGERRSSSRASYRWSDLRSSRRWGAGMGYRQFALFNVAGGISWVSSMTLGGYFLGSAFPGAGHSTSRRSSSSSFHCL